MNPFPDLAPDEYDALLLDIEKRGIVYPIVIDQGGQVIDGHQRQRIAQTLGIDPPVKVITVADDAERDELAIALNVHRRHLTPEARRAAILRLRAAGLTVVETAAATGTSRSEVSRVATPDAVSQVGNPPDDPATDRQGRLPDERGGRPRSIPTPEPIVPTITYVMKAFRRDVTRLVEGYAEFSEDEKFAGEFGSLLTHMKEVIA